jgi:AraC-like DNA-binding protein
MVAPYIVRNTDWLAPGSPDHPGLFHCDRDDTIQICPANLGRGYVQKIPLREDLSLVIIDYTLHQPLLIDAPGDRGLLEFEFQLSGRNPGQSFFVPYFGLREVGVKPAKKRIFKVEIFFKPPTLNAYFQDFTQRLSAPIQQVIESILRQLCRQQAGISNPSFSSALDYLVSDQVLFEQPFEQLLSNALYSNAAVLGSATRHPITPAMEAVLSQILHCPYQGATRRRYLECKALELVTLRLEAGSKPPAIPLVQEDIHRIHRAETILRNQLQQPPSVETLARQVALNRLKLNQGFHHVFGKTPYGHLRYCRLRQARRLLMTTDLSIEHIAEQVGYTSRSRFANAFRKEYGLNPKVFQMQCWQLAG